MSSVLDNIFLAESMSATAQRFDEQDSDHSFLEVFEGGEAILPTGDLFSWDEVTFSRGMAPVGGASSPNRSTRAAGQKEKSGRVYKIGTYVDLDARFLLMARGQGELIPNPEQQLANAIKQATGRVKRTKNAWCARALLSSSGVDLGLLPNSDIAAGAVVLAYPVTTLSAAAAWSNPATKLRSVEINALKLAYHRRAGMRAGYAIASDAVEGYITGNSEVTNGIHGSPGLSERMIATSFEEGGVVGFGGLGWKFARDFYVTDANENAGTPETTTDIISDPDLVAVLPDRSMWGEAFAHVEGLNVVPTGLISSLAVGSPLALLTTQRGWAAWLELRTNPAGLRLHVQWTGSFVQKAVSAALILNTTP